MSVIDENLPRGYDGTFVFEIPGFDSIIYRQETDHTCGPASIRMLLLNFGLNISESKIADECFTLPSGTLHWGADAALDFYLEPLQLASDLRSPTNYSSVKRAIGKNRPVLFIFATNNELSGGEKCLHYSLVIGINEIARTVTIANPFGHIDLLSLSEWWSRFSLRDDYLPDIEAFAVDIGILGERTAFLIEKRTWYFRFCKWVRSFRKTSNPAVHRTLRDKAAQRR